MDQVDNDTIDAVDIMSGSRSRVSVVPEPYALLIALVAGILLSGISFARSIWGEMVGELSNTNLTPRQHDLKVNLSLLGAKLTWFNTTGQSEKSFSFFVIWEEL